MYAGSKPQFLALAPWVQPDAPRTQLASTSSALAPGSGDPRENAYIETAVYADLLSTTRPTTATVPRTRPAPATLPMTGGAAPWAALLALFAGATILRRRRSCS